MTIDATHSLNAKRIREQKHEELFTRRIASDLESMHETTMETRERIAACRATLKAADEALKWR
jgi:hypothetical protein